MIPGFSTAKLIGLAIAAASILSFVLLAFHWKHAMTERGDKLSIICTATRAASGQPKLKCSQVPQQIQFMGEAITTLKGAVAKQNVKIDAMGAETKRQQGIAAKAENLAAERQKAVSATQQRLEASARSGAGKLPCEPSDELKGTWQ